MQAHRRPPLKGGRCNVIVITSTADGRIGMKPRQDWIFDAHGAQRRYGRPLLPLRRSEKKSAHDWPIGANKPHGQPFSSQKESTQRSYKACVHTAGAKPRNS